MGENGLVQGRYRLLDLIGRGGMGEVWRARDECLGRQVAVKRLKPLGPHHDPALGGVLRERFRREARVAAALSHRGVTVVHDFGEDGGVAYLVMELLRGRDLSRLLEDGRGHPLPVDAVADIAGQTAVALAYTHRQGVVHRDLKPANIVLLTDGTVKICDFGIARLGDDIGFTARLTGTGVALGTPHYMSPEQIGGDEVDRRSDLYSLGCVLYEIATGVPPFDLEDAWAILIGHRDTTPRPPRELRPELPAYLDRIILDLLAKQPAERPYDADELSDRIREGRAGVAVPPPGPYGRPEPSHRLRAAVVPTFPFLPPDRPREGRLPSWSRGMSTGHKAVGAGLRALPPDPGAALTGRWAEPATLLSDPSTRALAPRAARHHEGARLSGQGPEQDVDEAHLVVPADRAALRGPHHLLARPAGEGCGPDVDGAHPAVPADRASLGGPHHPEVLAERHDAAVALLRCGRATEALAAFGEVAGGWARVLGAEHPETLAARHEVAVALLRCGRATEALAAFGEVAEGRGRVLGLDHPDTLASRQETAYALGRLGRHAEARRIYHEVLDARERTMGPEHPDTLRCKHNLACTLGRLGQAAEARRLAGEVAAARSRLLGPDHPDTLASRCEVAYAQGQSGHWEEALHTYREVARTRARVLGADHPDTLAARYETALSLGRLGRSTDALGVYRDLIVDRTRVQGPTHPETLRARHGLGVHLGRLGHWEDALSEAGDVCALRERLLGADHPDTLVSRREVAVALGWLGRWADALGAYRRVAATRERTLGPDHPDTLAARDDEAHCRERLGRTPEAGEAARGVAGRRRHHPSNSS
ncbi:tetratricopeptide repeat protein [Streptomyces sp. NPDC014846]|uniref:serine/threonine-protein kinase n=1 Tax=Streptomyces sp. NPDC014846 TaxID=3364922 RepID=UPI0036FCA953